MTNLLLILLLLVGCSEDENPVADTTSNEVDVDWILVRDPAFQIPYPPGLPPAVGYYFFYTNTTSIIANGNIDLPGNYISPVMEFIATIEDSSYLSFTYNGEDFTYNISDLDALDYLSISSYSTRIIYNQDMDYLTLLDNTYIFMGGLDVSEPAEVIDYR